MKRRRRTPEQIIRKLREANRVLDEGVDVAGACRHLEVSVPTDLDTAPKVADQFNQNVVSKLVVLSKTDTAFWVRSYLDLHAIVRGPRTVLFVFTREGASVPGSVNDLSSAALDLLRVSRSRTSTPSPTCTPASRRASNRISRLLASAR